MVAAALYILGGTIVGVSIGLWCAKPLASTYTDDQFLQKRISLDDAPRYVSLTAIVGSIDRNARTITTQTKDPYSKERVGLVVGYDANTTVFNNGAQKSAETLRAGDTIILTVARTSGVLYAFSIVKRSYL